MKANGPGPPPAGAQTLIANIAQAGGEAPHQMGAASVAPPGAPQAAAGPAVSPAEGTPMGRESIPAVPGSGFPPVPAAVAAPTPRAAVSVAETNAAAAAAAGAVHQASCAALAEERLRQRLLGPIVDFLNGSGAAAGPVACCLCTWHAVPLVGNEFCAGWVQLGLWQFVLPYHHFHRIMAFGWKGHVRRGGEQPARSRFPNTVCVPLPQAAHAQTGALFKGTKSAAMTTSSMRDSSQLLWATGWSPLPKAAVRRGTKGLNAGRCFSGFRRLPPWVLGLGRGPHTHIESPAQEALRPPRRAGARRSRHTDQEAGDAHAQSRRRAEAVCNAERKQHVHDCLACVHRRPTQGRAPRRKRSAWMGCCHGASWKACCKHTGCR